MMLLILVTFVIGEINIISYHLLSTNTEKHEKQFVCQDLSLTQNTEKNLQLILLANINERHYENDRAIHAAYPLNPILSHDTLTESPSAEF